MLWTYMFVVYVEMSEMNGKIEKRGIEDVVVLWSVFDLLLFCSSGFAVAV